MLNNLPISIIDIGWLDKSLTLKCFQLVDCSSTYTMIVQPAASLSFRSYNESKQVSNWPIFQLQSLVPAVLGDHGLTQKSTAVRLGCFFGPSLIIINFKEEKLDENSEHYNVQYNTTRTPITMQKPNCSRTFLIWHLIILKCWCNDTDL